VVHRKRSRAPTAGQWNLSPSENALLATAVQMGFVAGTALAAVLNLADLLPARTYFAGCALLGAAANAALAWTPSYAAALGLRFLTGMFLAGVYPPAMKMVATWFRAAHGLTIGTLVGALTVGKTTPYVFRVLEPADYRGVVLAASGCAVAGTLLVAWAIAKTPSRSSSPFPGGGSVKCCGTAKLD
jgi:MFS family permease